MKLTKRKKILIAICVIILCVGLFILWDIGSSMKQRIILATRDISCVGSPIYETTTRILYGMDETRPICMAAGERFTDSAIATVSYPLRDRDSLDYLMLEDYLYQGILPVTSVDFECQSDICTPDLTEAWEPTQFYISIDCDEIPMSEADLRYDEVKDILQSFFELARECTLTIKEISVEELERRALAACPPKKTGIPQLDFYDELFCDVIQPKIGEWKDIRESAEGQLPIFFAFDGREAQAVMVADMRELGILSGMLYETYDLSPEVSAFKQGAITRFRDGTTSLEQHLQNLKAEAQALYEKAKKAPVISSQADDPTHEKIMKEVSENLLDIMAEQLDKLEADERRGDYETGTMRAEFLLSFRYASGWLYTEDSFPITEDSTELKYLTANCVEWTAAHPEAEWVYCGSSILDAGETLSVDEVVDVMGLENVTIEFRAKEASSLFEWGQAELNGGVLTAIDKIRIRTEALLQGDTVIVEFSRA